jgi:hypothetical protein
MTKFTYNLLNILIGLDFLLQNYCEEKVIVCFLYIFFVFSSINCKNNVHNNAVSENDLFISNQFSK